VVIVAAVKRIRAQYFTAIAETIEFYRRRRRSRSMLCGATSIDEDKC